MILMSDSIVAPEIIAVLMYSALDTKAKRPTSLCGST